MSGVWGIDPLCEEKYLNEDGVLAMCKVFYNRRHFSSSYMWEVVSCAGVIVGDQQFAMWSVRGEVCPHYGCKHTERVL